MRICTVADCQDIHLALGYCKKHYKKFKLYGNPLVTRIDNHTVKHKTEYVTWQDMKYRCSNPKLKAYPRYGGRGIKVCDRWLGVDGFKNFLKDMGKRPSNKHSIDRIDNDGNYEPSNCRWATALQQAKTSHRPMSKTGYRYISWNNFGQRYLIRIKRDGEYLLLTTRNTLDEAIKIRDKCMESYGLNYPD